MKQKGLPTLEKKTKKVYPNQYICEEVANGVMCNGNFYPYKSLENTLNAKIGIRYYLKQALLSGVREGAFPWDNLYIHAHMNGINIAIANIFAPTTAAVTDLVYVYQAFPVNLLMDENTHITKNSDNGHWEISNISFIYAEIDVLPGGLNSVVR